MGVSYTNAAANLPCCFPAREKAHILLFDLYDTICTVDTDDIAIFNRRRCYPCPDDGRDPVLSRRNGRMREHTPTIRDHPSDLWEDGCPCR